MAAVPDSKKVNPLPRRLLYLGIGILCFVGLAWLTTWLIQRSFHSPANKRAMQSWLDDNLNTDVALLGNMTVRLNLLRKSRLVFNNVEIEHPNPVFSGKFCTIERMGAWIQPWSMLRLWPGAMSVLFQGAKVLVEENEVGEWSLEGLMRPLSNVDSPFPFSAPKVAEWHARIVDASILIRRRGYDLELNLNPAEASGQAGNDLVTLTADRAPFSFGRTGSEKRFTGRAGAISLMFPINPGSGFSPFPTPGQSSIRVEGLPVAMAPFLLSGIPLENTAGFFTGSIAYREHPDAAGVLTFEGELHDALLSIFGLPRNAPLRLNWPMGPKRPNLNVGLHLGPSGFGAFTMVVSLDASGRPRLLSMQGEIAALDDIPDIISRNERWTDWLSRSFTSVEWRTAKWRGFGWSGEDMRLNLIRTTAGLNLTGEAELMRGRLQLALAPNQQDMPISLAGEQIDAGLMSANLSDRLPEAFRVRLAGSHASFNWRGYRTDEGIGDWSAGLVFVKPEIDIAASGAWWTILGEAARAIAQALPEWGGGDPAGLLAIAAGVKLPLDQLSIVAEQSAEAYTVIEFRAYGDVFGQATGMLESRPDGTVEGEFRLDGPSQVIAEVERVNSDLALILALLANDSPGLRIQFLAQPDKKPEFNFPFLDEAKSILEELTREKMGEG